MKCQSITIRRTGQIDWYVKPGSRHCGPASGINLDANHNSYVRVRYVLHMKCTTQLDERGFLVDQMAVHRYIKAWSRTPRDLSCERGAMALAEAIWTKTQASAPHCKPLLITLELSPEPFQAAITVEYS